jgi:hypothetical protein
MSNFPIHHGITLAPNAFIENLQLEIRASDPTAPLVAGRVWFNSTEKSLKYTTLDANDNVIVVANVVSADVAAALQSANDYTDTSIAALVNSAPEILNTLKELSDAIAGDDQFSATVLTWISNAKAEILGTVGASFDTLGEIETKLNQLDAADTIPGSVAYKVKVESDRAILEEGNLDSRLDVLEGPDTLSGSVAKVAKAVADEETARLLAASDALDARVAVEGLLTDLQTEEQGSLVASINEVDTRLSQVESDVGTNIGDLSLLTTDDKTDLVSAINEVDAHTNDNATAIGTLASLTTTATSTIVAAINSVKSELTTETSDRGDAELAITNRLDVVEGDATIPGSIIKAVADEKSERETAAEEALAARVAVELDITNRLDVVEGDATVVGSIAKADADLRSDINAGQHWEQTASAATVHTINHGLNSTQTSFTVLVERAEGGYRNDIVSVEEVDGNTLKVYLSDAKRIKIFVQKFEAV